MSEQNYFEILSEINVNGHTEKKGKFTYLSWPFAYAELFKRHPNADIMIRDWNGFPAVQGPKGWMVCVTVTISKIARTQWHPVLDNNNKTIVAPDVFQVNTAIQRAAVKAIALHGLGLYIYAGEDVPGAPTEEVAETQTSAEGGRPNSGVWESLNDTERETCKQTAQIIHEYMDGEDAKGAVEYLSAQGFGADMKTGVWGLLSSSERSAIKKATKEMSE